MTRTLAKIMTTLIKHDLYECLWIFITWLKRSSFYFKTCKAKFLNTMAIKQSHLSNWFISFRMWRCLANLSAVKKKQKRKENFNIKRKKEHEMKYLQKCMLEQIIWSYWPCVPKVMPKWLKEYWEETNKR